MNKLSIENCRNLPRYDTKTQVLRVLWALGQLFFRLSPRPFFGWRNCILRVFGAHIGKHVHIYASARIRMPWNLVVDNWAAIGENAVIYNLGKITIGERATISQQAHLCAGSHDFEDPNLPLLTMPIVIGNEAWVCADAFVGPGVTIGPGAVVGARAVITKDVEARQVVAGNPAVVMKERVMHDDE